MNRIAATSTVSSTIKFGKFNVNENGLILNKKNKEENVFQFSELNKIYIKKIKFSFLHKIGLLSLLLILIAISFVILPVELVLLTSILYITLVVKINTYKRYQLNILLKDGTFFIKFFNKNTKQEYIRLVNRVRKEIFDNQIQFINNKEILSNAKTISEDYVFSTLSIA